MSSSSLPDADNPRTPSPILTGLPRPSFSTLSAAHNRDLPGSFFVDQSPEQHAHHWNNAMINLLVKALLALPAGDRKYKLVRSPGFDDLCAKLGDLHVPPRKMRRFVVINKLHSLGTMRHRKLEEDTEKLIAQFAAEEYPPDPPYLTKPPRKRKNRSYVEENDSDWEEEVFGETRGSVKTAAAPPPLPAAADTTVPRCEPPAPPPPPPDPTAPACESETLANGGRTPPSEAEEGFDLAAPQPRAVGVVGPCSKQTHLFRSLGWAICSSTLYCVHCGVRIETLFKV